jgi:hypothetical protein
MKNLIKNLEGQTFGKWVVLTLLSRRAKNGGVYFLCSCSGCGKNHDIASTTLIQGRSTQCWECVLKERRTNTKDTCKIGHFISDWGRTSSGACRACVKHKSLLRCYGITLEEFIFLYNQQEGKCPICGRDLGPYVPLQPGWDKGCRIEVDHDHKLVGKEAVRGLLCGGRWAGCNRKLGRIDSVEWMKSALDYVKNPPAKRFLLTIS